MLSDYLDLHDEEVINLFWRQKLMMHYDYFGMLVCLAAARKYLVHTR